MLVPRHPAEDFINGSAVIILHAAPQSECEHFSRQTLKEFVAFLGDENFVQFGRISEGFSADEGATGVHGEGTIFLTPGAGGVEILKTETDGVHAGVAGGADGFFAVLLHALAQAAGEDGLLLFAQLRDVRRGRRRRGAQDVLQYPLAALDGGGAGGIGGDGEDAALGEDADAAAILENHILEVWTEVLIDPIVAGEAVVEEAVIGGQQLDDTAVPAQKGLKKEFGLLAHVVAQLGAPGGEEFGVGGDGGEVADLEPLAGEIVDEGAGSGVLEHAHDFGLEIAAEPFFGGEGEQPIVGHGAPEEIGEARGEGEFVDGMDGGRIVWVGLEFAAKEEAGRNQDGGEGDFDAALEGIAVIAGHGVEGGNAVDFGGGNGAAEGAAGEAVDDRAGVGVGVAGGAAIEENAAVGLGIGLDGDGADDFDVVDEEVAVALGGDVVVDIGGGQFVVAGGDGELDVVILGFALDGVNVEDLDGLAIEANFQAGSVGAGLLAEGAGAEDVLAGGGEVVGEIDFAFFVQGEGEAAVGLAALGGGGEFFGFDAFFGPIEDGTAFADGGAEDFFGGGEVFFEEDGREGEDVAYVVEAMAHVVDGEIVGRFELDADEVTDGVVVFGAVEPANGDAAGIGVFGVDAKNLALDELGDFLALLEGRLELFLGGHFAGFDVAEDEFPFLAVGEDAVEGFVMLEGEAAFGFFIAVAFEAILAEEGQQVLFEGGRPNRGGRGDHEKETEGQ